MQVRRVYFISIVSPPFCNKENVIEINISQYFFLKHPERSSLLVRKAKYNPWLLQMVFARKQSPCEPPSRSQ